MKIHYDIKTTSIFEKQFKKVIKKYKSLKKELAELILSLEENPSGSDKKYASKEVIKFKYVSNPPPKPRVSDQTGVNKLRETRSLSLS